LSEALAPDRSREIIGSLKNYAGFTEKVFFEIVIVPTFFSECFHNQKIFPCSFKHRNLSVALLHH